MFSQAKRVELESAMASCNAPIESEVLPRWKRKELAKVQANSRTPGAKKKALASRTPGGKTPKGDRFIPSRTALNLEASARFDKADGGVGTPSRGVPAEGASSAVGGAGRGPLRAALASSLLRSDVGEGGSGAGASTGAEQCEDAVAEGAELTGAGRGEEQAGGEGGGHRVLAFSSKAPAPTPGYRSEQRVLYSQTRERSRVSRSTRHIPSAPERILDAPDMVDDYYMNVLDWSKEDVLAVALGPTVYLWNAGTGNIDELMTCDGEDDYISSVSWVKEGGGFLAVGTSSSDVLLWDVNRMKQVRRMKGHTDRVGAMDWNRHMLATGGRDARVLLHDVRIREHQTGSLAGHSQEVCGVKWSPDGSTVASGGNDNLVCLWDAASAAGVEHLSPRVTFADHNAAVKALAWCPWQRNTLATGGGTADRHIRFWDTAAGTALNAIDTGSQVTALLWNPHHREIVSAHGYAKNEIGVWRYPSLVKTKELTGHTARVLHLAAGPDENTVVSAGADETLRFWKIFGEKPRKPSSSSSSSTTNTTDALPPDVAAAASLPAAATVSSSATSSSLRRARGGGALTSRSIR